MLCNFTLVKLLRIFNCNMMELKITIAVNTLSDSIHLIWMNNPFIMATVTLLLLLGLLFYTKRLNFNNLHFGRVSYFEDTQLKPLKRKLSRGFWVLKRKTKKKKNHKQKVSNQHPEELNLRDYLQPIFTSSQKRIFLALVGIWLASLALFLNFWFQAEHIVGWFRFFVNTFLLLWSMVLPGYFYFFVSRMKRVNPSMPIPKDWRIAMVVTRAPSEPFELIKKTLNAMLAQKTTHDTWLADEDPTDEIKAWCIQNEVRLSTRKNVPEYHQPVWPRRTKCKEGNLAYFYDKYGYENYDFVVQLDADHIPDKDYLEHMIRPFIHREVGYVSAPSICDTNGTTSWSARGRLFAESIMHGVLQAGYSFFYAPLCIGSHYAVRTTALKEIGGLGPELAEDHSTTLMFQANGWRGVHAFDAQANGEGPQTFGDCMTQEFQWSRSLVIIMLTFLPKYWKKLPLRLKVQFLFSQLWYPIFSVSMFVGILLPIIAVFTGIPWVSISFFDFLLHSIPVALSIIAVVWYIKEKGLLKPHYSPVISYETIIFQMVRWPWALYGSVMGLITSVWGKSPSFKVTPKGNRVREVMEWKLILPYVAIVLISFIPAFLMPENGFADGYFFFLILNTIIYNAVLFALIGLHKREAKKANKTLDAETTIHS
jgi:cellulose synthase (UDP-forming)